MSVCSVGDKLVARDQARSTDFTTRKAYTFDTVKPNIAQQVGLTHMQELTSLPSLVMHAIAQSANKSNLTNLTDLPKRDAYLQAVLCLPTTQPYHLLCPFLWVSSLPP